MTLLSYNAEDPSPVVLADGLQRPPLMAHSLPNDLDALTRLVDYQAGEPEDRRIQAVTALGNLLSSSGEGNLTAPRGILCLIDQVKGDTSARVVGHCIGVLGRIGAVSAVSTIIDVALGGEVAIYHGAQGKAFLDSDASVRLRCMAVQALGRLQDERAVIPLMSLLNDQSVNTRIRMAAAESLGKAGDPHAVSSLMSILQDEREKSLYLKESSAKALGMLGDIRAVDALLEVLETKRGIRDKFDFLREQAIEALGRIIGGGRKESHRVLDHLVLSLRDEAPSIRLAAVEALAELGDDRVLGELCPLIFDANDDVALMAVSAIYQLGGEAAIRDLLSQENIPQFVRDEMEAYIP